MHVYKYIFCFLLKLLKLLLLLLFYINNNRKIIEMTNKMDGTNYNSSLIEASNSNSSGIFKSVMGLFQSATNNENIDGDIPYQGIFGHLDSGKFIILIITYWKKNFFFIIIKIIIIIIIVILFYFCWYYEFFKIY